MLCKVLQLKVSFLKEFVVRTVVRSCCIKMDQWCRFNKASEILRN